MVRSAFLMILSALVALTAPARAADELVTSARTADGEAVPYILTTKPGTPAYAVILMPGGRGVVNPRMMDGKLVFTGFAASPPARTARPTPITATTASRTKPSTR